MNLNELRKGKVYKLTHGNIPIVVDPFVDLTKSEYNWIRHSEIHPQEGLEFLVTGDLLGSVGSSSRWLPVLLCHEAIMGYGCVNNKDQFEEIVDHE